MIEHLTHEIGTTILVLLYVLRLVILLRRRQARDFASDPKGTVWRGALDAVVTVVAPWKMESTRKHWVRYVEFVVFHAGVFANIALSFVIAYAPGLLSRPVRAVTFGLLGSALAAGVLRLYRRAARPDMRIISTPDDYIAVGMVLLFLVTGLLSLAGWAPGTVAYFVIAALFLIYEPFSKIRHYIYYPFARFFYGAAAGRRGVIGTRIGETRRGG